MSQKEVNLKSKNWCKTILKGLYYFLFGLLQMGIRTSCNNVTEKGWLRLIGKGAMLKLNDPFLLSGVLSSLQTQANINIHYGGRSALELQGKFHYLRFASPTVILFASG